VLAQQVLYLLLLPLKGDDENTKTVHRAFLLFFLLHRPRYWNGEYSSPLLAVADSALLGGGKMMCHFLPMLS
jgi:hypothetical protein